MKGMYRKQKYSLSLSEIFSPNVGQNCSLKCMSIHITSLPRASSTSPDSWRPWSPPARFSCCFSGTRASSLLAFLSSSRGNRVHASLHHWVPPLMLPPNRTLPHFCAPPWPNSALLISQVPDQTLCPSRFPSWPSRRWGHGFSQNSVPLFPSMCYHCGL